MVRFPEWNTYIQVYVQNCIVELMWTKIRNLQTRTPPGCLVTPPFNLFWHPEGGYRYTYIYISIVYLYVDFDANLLWKILGQFFVQREQSFTRHHVAPNSIEIIQTSFGSLPFRKTIHGGWMGQIFNLKSWDQSSSICLFDGERQKTYSLHSDLVVKWQFTLETS